MPDLHFEIFPPAQNQLWHTLGEHADTLNQWGYYLAGGSALALHIGHRQSIDFDFFSRQEGIGAASRDWLEKFSGTIIRDINKHTVHAEVQGVKVSLLGGYRYETVEEPIDVGGLRLASILDIGLMKLLSITHRAVLRDYIDLAVIIRDHIPLSILCERSREKYSDSFNVMASLRALVSFTDLDVEMPILLDKALEGSWQDILTKAVREAAG